MSLSMRIHRVRETIKRLIVLSAQSRTAERVAEYAKLAKLLAHDKSEMGKEMFDRIVQTTLDELNIPINMFA